MTIPLYGVPLNRPNGFGNLTSLFSAAQLQVTSTGQVTSAPECGGNGSLIYHDFTKQITAANVAGLQAQRKANDGGAAFLAKLRADAGAVVGYRAPSGATRAKRPDRPAAQAAPTVATATSIIGGRAESRTTAPTMALTTAFDTIPGEGHCSLTISSTKVTSGGDAAARGTSVPSSSSSSASSSVPTAASPSAPYPQQRVVLLVGAASARQAALAKALNGAGYSTVTMSPCGFGKDDAFPSSYKGMAACPDLAQNLNRSLVGVHAADIVRGITWLGGNFMGSLPLATIATGELHAAALHAAVLEPGSTGAVIQIGNQANYQEIANSLTYSQASEWSFIFDVLSHYDLPDVAAAIAPVPQLVYGATDSNGTPLSAAELANVYSFTESVYSAKEASSKLRVVPAASISADPTDEAKAVLSFLASLVPSL